MIQAVCESIQAKSERFYDVIHAKVESIHMWHNSENLWIDALEVRDFWWIDFDTNELIQVQNDEFA